MGENSHSQLQGSIIIPNVETGLRKCVNQALVLHAVSDIANMGEIVNLH